MGASDWPGGVDLIFRELLFLGAFYISIPVVKLQDATRRPIQEADQKPEANSRRLHFGGNRDVPRPYGGHLVWESVQVEAESSDTPTTAFIIIIKSWLPPLSENLTPDFRIFCLLNAKSSDDELRMLIQHK